MAGGLPSGLLRSESEFLSLVKELATDAGWLFYHTHDSRGSERGFPDCAIARAGVLHLWELKLEQGHLRQDQRRWLRACGPVFVGTAACYRPSDLPHIVRLLQSDPGSLWRPPYPADELESFAQTHHISVEVLRQFEERVRHWYLCAPNCSEETNIP